MKIALSIPDELFESGETLSKRLGVSRSRLYATALAEFVAKHRGQKVTDTSERRLRIRGQPAAALAAASAEPVARSRQVVVERGQVWWADLGEPDGSEPGYKRPVLIVQSDAFNRSRLHTVIAVVLSSNARLVDAPGNVLLPAKVTGLPKDSVANASQVITVDRDFLDGTRRPGTRPVPQGCRERSQTRARLVRSLGGPADVTASIFQTVWNCSAAGPSAGARFVDICRFLVKLRAFLRPVERGKRNSAAAKRSHNGGVLGGLRRSFAA